MAIMNKPQLAGGSYRDAELVIALFVRSPPRPRCREMPDADKLAGEEAAS
jgi:hypothetical protein